MPGTHIAISTRVISQRQEISGDTPQLRLTETDQTAPAGRYRLIVSGDVISLTRSRATEWDPDIQLNPDSVIFSFTPGNPADETDSTWGTLTFGSITSPLTLTPTQVQPNQLLMADNLLFLLGTTADQVMLNRASALAADTALTSVLLGTTAGSRQALAANSLIVSNVTASGDMGFYVNTNPGGNALSEEWLLVDASAQSLMLGYAMTDLRFLTTAIMGTGEGLVTAPTGGTFRAPDVIAGGAGNIAGADLTIAAGLGTGTGDVGTIIFSLPIVAVAGDNIQTRVTGMTLDMAGSATAPTVLWPTGSILNFGAGNITLTHSAGLLTLAGGDLVLNDNVGLAFGTASDDGRLYSDGTDIILHLVDDAGSDTAFVVGPTNATAGIASVKIRSARTGVSHGILQFNAARGDVGAETAITSGDDIGRIYAAGFDDAAYDPGAYLGFWASETHTATNHGTEFRIYTVPLGSVTATLRVTVTSEGAMLFTGTLALTGSRVTQSYHTNITSTNAVTVDSSILSKVPESIRDYVNALDIIDGIHVVENQHRSELDPSGRHKLSVIAESIREPLVLQQIDSPWGGSYPGVDLMGLSALNTRGIQELLARVIRLEHQLAAVGIEPER